MDQLVQHKIVEWNNDVLVSTEANDFKYQALTHNLINNAFMQHKNGKKPAGYLVGNYQCSGCKLELEAVHPYTKVGEKRENGRHRSLKSIRTISSPCAGHV